MASIARRRFAAPIVAGAMLACLAAAAQAQPAPSRVDLQRHDLSIPGWEAVQVRVDFPPGGYAPWRQHPGEEIIHVLRGTAASELAT